MNARSKISSKGQVVVPKDIRDKLGLKEGSEVEFVEKPGGVFIKRIRPMTELFPPISREEFIARRVKWTGKPVSIDDMKNAVADEARRMWNAKNS